MEKLAARVEALAGPDRRIDTEILEMVGGFTPTGLPTFRGGLGYPAFTQSVDAAMSLVPEGWAWTLYSDASCEIGYEPERGGLMNPEFQSDAATPALALCAAALRARPTATGESGL